MVSPRKQTANAQNAAKSTGPRTAGGKARSRTNATAHGLRAVNPVLPGEDPAQWEAFRTGVAADLGAVGTLETEMAGRVALLQWRLRRVAAFEASAGSAPADGRGATGLAAAFHAAAGRRHAAAIRTADILDRILADGPVAGAEAVFLLRRAAGVLPPAGGEAAGWAHWDDEEPTGPPVDGPDFLRGLGVPERHFGDPAGWDGWTPAAVRRGFARLAEIPGWTAERFAADARRLAADEVVMSARDLADRRERLAAAERQDADAAARHRLAAAVPTGAALEAVLRYEPHLARQLADALTLFERVRGRRE